MAGGGTIETQMVGQSGESASQVIGRFSDDSGGPGLKFAKSRTSTIGGFELVQDNDAIGFVQFYASDNTDLATRLAGYSLR